MAHRTVELLAVGAGPANLALAVALEELAPELAGRTLVVEREENVVWQRGMLLPDALSRGFLPQGPGHDAQSAQRILLPQLPAGTRPAGRVRQPRQLGAVPQ
ncbi:hypothetical protein SHIRM173S_03568 [Streptomyces hirsutus]